MAAQQIALVALRRRDRSLQLWLVALGRGELRTIRRRPWRHHLFSLDRLLALSTVAERSGGSIAPSAQKALGCTARGDARDRPRRSARAGGRGAYPKRH